MRVLISTPRQTKKQLLQLELNVPNKLTKLYGYSNYVITVILYASRVLNAIWYTALYYTTYVALILWMLYYKNIHSPRKGTNLARTTSVKLLPYLM